MRRGLLAWVVLAGALCAQAGQRVYAQTTLPVGGGVPEMGQILEKLSSGDFAEREAGQAALDKIPADQIKAMLKLFQEATDGEVKARLWRRAGDMGIELARRPAGAEPEPFQLALRLVGAGEKGRAIARAQVETRTFPSGLVVRGYSDADGRVSFGVPLDENVYAVQVNAPGYGQHTVHVLKKAGAGEMEVVVPPDSANASAVIGGVILTSNGKPVAGQKLRLATPYDIEYEATTGAAGEFSVEVYAGHAGGIFPVIRYEGEVALEEGLRNVQMPATLRLVPSAGLVGKVMDGSTGRAVAGVRVVARLGEMVFGETKTGADGRYKMTGISPGQHEVTVDDPGYFVRVPPERRQQPPNLLILPAGETIAAPDIVVQRNAILMGRVVDGAGRGVRGASVRVLGDAGAWRHVESGTDGEYLISTKRVGDRGLRILACSATAGDCDLPVGEVAAGEIYPLGDIVLPGTIRFKGMVVDAAGKPIPDIDCVFSGNGNAWARTKADGVFDFGRLSLPYGGVQAALQFRAPRPAVGDAQSMENIFFAASEGGGAGGQFVPVTSRERAPQFYQHMSMPWNNVERDVGETNLRIALPAAHLLELTGTVENAKGEKVVGAAVSLLTNEALETTWEKHMEAMDGAGANNFFFDREIPMDLRRAVVVTDAQGQWHLFTIREEVENRSHLRGGAGDPEQVVTVGARFDGQEDFLADQPIGDREKLEFKLRLHEPPKPATQPARGDTERN